MKALSIKQPYASLIAHGIKDIENRTWQTHFRGRIFIHASAKKVIVDFTTGQTAMIYGTDLFPDTGHNFAHEKFPTSAIIGEVDIIDCVQDHPSIWAEKHNDIMGEFIHKPIWNWVLANAVLYEKPILKVKGKLSFWFPDTDIMECIGCSQKFDSEFMEEDDANEKYCQECWEVLSPIMKQEAKEIEESEFCECPNPTQSLFPDGKYRCINEECFKIWFH
ncbi:ASCH domain-containing protein [Flavobacterium sp. GT3P67]|uniref:ASCH domain-containing protein n=1 Tax=Flavobacterium sp. GT3P67 TaxID=2541722 RepID=UPI00104BF8CC|nr:ASCH domain-containing protein [Flavobacterium sp. GT3P67]TDE53772.1 ASCH domain-containing protein [Flavobacterium sp. GT3P67]